MLEPRHLIRFPIKTQRHTHRGSTQQTTCPSLTSLPLYPSLRASPLPFTAHTRLKCGIVVCLVLLLCAVQKNFFNKNIKFAYVAPRRWQRSKLSWQLSPSLSHSPQARRFGVAFGYLWQELLLPPEVVTRQQQRQHVVLKLL